jgi:hypothetical protein
MKLWVGLHSFSFHSRRMKKSITSPSTTRKQTKNFEGQFFFWTLQSTNQETGQVFDQLQASTTLLPFFNERQIKVNSSTNVTSRIKAKFKRLLRLCWTNWKDLRTTLRRLAKNVRQILSREQKRNLAEQKIAGKRNALGCGWSEKWIG